MNTKKTFIKILSVLIFATFLLLFSTQKVSAFDSNNFTQRFNYSLTEQQEINETLESDDYNKIMGMLFQNTTTYYRDTLKTSVEKEFYNTILEQVKNFNSGQELWEFPGDTNKYQLFRFKKTLDASLPVLEYTKNAFRSVLEDHKEFFYFSGASKYQTEYIETGLTRDYTINIYASVYDKYFDDKNYNGILLRDAKDMIANIYKITKEAHKLPLPLKIRYYHDWLVRNNSYNITFNTPLQHSPISAFTNHYLPVCEGYAEAFNVLLNVSGINNIYAVGVATNSSGSSENHAWNYVFIEESLYMIDVTWDDPTGAGVNNWDVFYKYYLVKTPATRKLFIDRDNNPMPEYDINLVNFINSKCTSNFYTHVPTDYGFNVEPTKIFDHNSSGIKLYNNSAIRNRSTFYNNVIVKAYNTATGAPTIITNLEKANLDVGEYIIIVEFKNNKSYKRTIASYIINIQKNARLLLKFSKQDVMLTNGTTSSDLLKEATGLDDITHETSTKTLLDVLTNTLLPRIDILFNYKVVEFRFKNYLNKPITQELVATLADGTYELIAVYSAKYTFVFDTTEVFAQSLLNKCTTAIFSSTDEFILKDILGTSSDYNKLLNNFTKFLQPFNFHFYKIFIIDTREIITEANFSTFLGIKTKINFGIILDFEYVIDINSETKYISRTKQLKEVYLGYKDNFVKSGHYFEKFVEVGKDNLDLTDKERNIKIVPTYQKLTHILKNNNGFSFSYTDLTNTISYDGKFDLDKTKAYFQDSFSKKGFTVTNIEIIEQGLLGDVKRIKCFFKDENEITQELIFNIATASPTQKIKKYALYGGIALAVIFILVFIPLIVVKVVRKSGK